MTWVCSIRYSPVQAARAQAMVEGKPWCCGRRRGPKFAFGSSMHCQQDQPYYGGRSQRGTYNGVKGKFGLVLLHPFPHRLLGFGFHSCVLEEPWSSWILPHDLERLVIVAVAVDSELDICLRECSSERRRSEHEACDRRRLRARLKSIQATTNTNRNRRIYIRKVAKR